MAAPIGRATITRMGRDPRRQARRGSVARPTFAARSGATHTGWRAKAWLRLAHIEFGRPLPANQSWEQIDLAALWNWREEGATVNGAVDRDGDAAVENRPQLRIKFAQPCEQVTDGRGLNLELRRTTSL